MSEHRAFIEVAHTIQYHKGDKYNLFHFFDFDPDKLVGYIYARRAIHEAANIHPKQERMLGQAIECYWYNEVTTQKRRELIDKWITEGSIVWIWRWLKDWKSKGSGGIWDRETSIYFSQRVHHGFTPEQKLSTRWIAMFSTIWNWNPNNSPVFDFNTDHKSNISLPLSSYRALFEWCYASGNFKCFAYSVGVTGPCRKYGYIKMQECILKWLENERDETCNALLNLDLIPINDILCIISDYIFNHTVIH